MVALDQLANVLDARTIFAALVTILVIALAWYFMGFRYKRVKPLQDGQVALLRHAEGHHQLNKNRVVDPKLSEYGKEQALSWARIIHEFAPDLVLVSPLRRTIQTACLAFSEKRTIPLELCRRARECGWKNSQANSEKHGDKHFSPEISDTKNMLHSDAETRQRPVEQFEDSIFANEDVYEERDWPQDSKEFDKLSAEALCNILDRHVKDGKKVLVVCHGMLMRKLCGVIPRNCEIVVCQLDDRKLHPLDRYLHPGDTSRFAGVFKKNPPASIVAGVACSGRG